MKTAITDRLRQAVAWLEDEVYWTLPSDTGPNGPRSHVRATAGLLRDVLREAAALVAALTPTPAPQEEKEKDKIAARYFEACHIESQLDEVLMRAFGASVASEGLTMGGTDYVKTDVDTWPCGHMVYDDYDSSFELWDITDAAWVPTVEQLNAALDLGFGRCWLVYKDGTERYCVRGTIGDKRPSHSDRSSESKYLRAKLQREIDRLARLLDARPTRPEGSQATGSATESLSFLAVPDARAEGPTTYAVNLKPYLRHLDSCESRRRGSDCDCGYTGLVKTLSRPVAVAAPGAEDATRIAEKLDKIAKCIYIAADKVVADDVSACCREAATALRLGASAPAAGSAPKEQK